MKSSQIMFFAIFGLLLIGGHIYVLWRLWQLIPATVPALRIAAVVCGVLLTAAFIVGMAGRSGPLPVPLLSLLFRIGSGWVFVFFYTMLIFLVGDLLRLVHLIPKEWMLGNWVTLGVLAGVLAVIFTAGNITYHNKRRVETDLEANTARPLKIVAASDLHLGYGIGRKELARWVDMINREKPDAVVFAGDIIDTSTRPLWQGGFADELRRIDAPLGVFAVPGNHEYISGLDESLRFLEHAGVTVLRDSVAVIADNLAVVGRDDASNDKRKTVAELVGRLPGGCTTILLDHQPYHLEEAEEAGIGLQISGHTHRGQIWPATWITDAIFEKSHGPLQKGDTRYYITEGLGIWGGKFRIGSRSEYIVVNLTNG